MSVDIVSLIKQHILIEDVITKDGYPLPNRGRYRKALHSNGLVVDTNLQSYHWNGRGEYGDVIQWTMSAHSCDFKMACEMLCRSAGLPDPVWSERDHEARIAARKKEDVLTVAARVFSAWFWASAEAQAYIDRRGLTLLRDKDEDETIYSGGTAERAMLGYSGSGTKAEREEMRKAMESAGVDLESTAAVAVLGYQGDVMRWAKAHDLKADDLNEDWVSGTYIPGMLGGQRIVFPYKVYGRVVYMAGRSIQDKRHHNLPEVLVGARPDVYMNHVWQQKTDMVISEGQMDAETWAQWGIAGIGMSGAKLADDTIEYLRSNCQAVYLSIDADVAGLTSIFANAPMIGPMTRILCPRDMSGQFFPVDRQMSESQREHVERANKISKSLEKCFNFTIPAKFCGFSDKDRKIKDINDLLQALKENKVSAQDQEIYAKALLKAAPTYAELVATWAGTQEGAERDAATRVALGVICQMSDIERSQYRTKLAKLMGIGMRELDSMLKTLTKEEEKEKSEGEPEFTYGGHIGGHLVEYLYDTQSNRSFLAWRSPDGTIDSGPSLIIDGKRYIPEEPTESMKNGSVLFPSRLGEKKTVRELINYIELYLKAIGLFPSDMTRKLISLWILNTWVYDCFDAVSYLTFMGDTGAGKSELMFRVGMIAYRPMSLSGASSVSSFFRMVNKYKGTVLIDEGDLQRSDTTQDIVKFYNQGAMKGRPITKMTDVVLPDGRHDYQEVAFQTYCPKANTLKKAFYDDAVTSRSIVIKLQARETIELVKSNIPLNINEELRNRAQTMRNLLLRFRMEKWKEEIPVNTDFYDFTVSARLNQIAGGLLMMADEDEQLQEMIRENLRDYYRESQISKSMSMDARVIEAMWTIYKFMRDDYVVLIEGKEGIKTGVIAKIANKIVERMNSAGDEEDGEDDDGEESSGSFGKNRKNKNALTAHSVGTKNRSSLQLETSKRTRDGFFIMWDQLRMEGLALRYGVDIEQLEPIDRTELMRTMDPMLDPQKSKIKLQEKLV